MKKIIFLLICFFSININVFAAKLISEDTNYYVKIKNGTSPWEVINVKKIYDEDSLNVVFNANYNNYDVNNNFSKYREYDRKIWKMANKLPMFQNITYYGYINNPSDLNYFLTQVFVWKWVSNYDVEITDSLGNIITEYNKEYDVLYNKINNHNLQSPFFEKTYSTEIWTTNKYTYHNLATILDNPQIKGLDIYNINKDIYIYNENIGNYEIEFTKNYEQEYYCYSDGTNIYWQNLKGASNLSKTLNYNVYGTKLNIKENYIGINNRYGDALQQSNYELYLEDELKLNIKNLNNIYIKSNSNYILRDVSNDTGFNNIEEISFNVTDKEYSIIIDKYVINKNITIDIKDNKKYYIYLKSNNELYEEIDSYTNLINLPYGLYYITDKSEFYKEIIVNNNIDEELVIDNIIKENLVEKEPELIYENNILENEVKEKKLEEKIAILEVENPQTLDNIYKYLISFIVSLIITIYLLKSTYKLR